MTTQRARAEGTTTRVGDGMRRLLFVLEDDPYARDLLVEVAGDAGWDARGFASIPSMRRALDHAAPDLLMIDDDVADGRGGEFARQVREDRRTQGLRIVILTEAAHMRRAELATWASVVAKPFNLADLERRLTAIIGTGRTDRAQPAAN
jgi:DNA-binding response OmpR family regulator